MTDLKRFTMHTPTPALSEKVNEIRCRRFNVAESRAARRALKEYGKAIRRGDLEKAREIFHALVVIVDEDHWKMARIAERLLGVDTEKACEAFEYEELYGVFSAIEDGLSMILWLERCSGFYLKDYTPIAAGYETSSWRFDKGQDSASASTAKNCLRNTAE